MLARFPGLASNHAFLFEVDLERDGLGGRKA